MGTLPPPSAGVHRPNDGEPTGRAAPPLARVCGGRYGAPLFAEPTYQVGIVPDALATRWNGLNRVVPDVATVGDPTTGFLVGETQAFPSGAPRYAECRIGGTSLSCPVFAAIMALADQAKGIHHGFANPLLYSLAGSAAFRDIVDPPSPMAAVRTDWANFLNPHQGQSCSRCVRSTRPAPCTPRLATTTSRA